MTAPEKIVLPRSGLTAIVQSVYGAWDAVVETEVLNIAVHHKRTRDDAIESMDSNVLALLSALLPPNAIVVVLDEATRERVLSVLIDSLTPEDGWSDALRRDVADEILAALRKEGA